MFGISLATGYGQAFWNKTAGKAIQNSERVVYEETNSFVKGKRQEAIKAYKEWLLTEDPQEKRAIEVTLSMSLADFDEDTHIHDAKLLSWIKTVKY